MPDIVCFYSSFFAIFVNQILLYFMLHTTVVPQSTDLHIDIPTDYVGQEVEVLLYTKEESMPKNGSDVKHTSFTVLHVDHTDYRFNRDEANER